MAIAATFRPKGMTLAQFDEIHRRLDAAGEGDNPHRLHHSCTGVDGDLVVYDVWDSPQSFEAFGGVLMSILAEVGVDAGQSEVAEVHKLVQSASD